ATRRGEQGPKPQPEMPTNHRKRPPRSVESSWDGLAAFTTAGSETCGIAPRCCRDGIAEPISICPAGQARSPARDVAMSIIDPSCGLALEKSFQSVKALFQDGQARREREAGVPLGTERRAHDERHARFGERGHTERCRIRDLPAPQHAPEMFGNVHECIESP